MCKQFKILFGLAMAVTFSTATVAMDRPAVPTSESQTGWSPNRTIHTGHGSLDWLATESSRPVYVELRIDACNPESVCRLASLLFDPYHVSLMTCMIAGQREVAAWSLQNPTWTVKRWLCRLTGNSFNA